MELTKDETLDQLDFLINSLNDNEITDENYLRTLALIKIFQYQLKKLEA